MYWAVVALMTVASWYRSDGRHLRNRAAVAFLAFIGAMLMGLPVLAALILAAATAIWSVIPMQWPRASAAAGIAAGAGIMAWALDLSLS